MLVSEGWGKGVVAGLGASIRWKGSQVAVYYACCGVAIGCLWDGMWDLVCDGPVFGCCCMRACLICYMLRECGYGID